ncbi:MAG: hypothetical protein KKD94_01655 [Nanoarchaeota archaeon]|nr:hypothetical protein [Nanoarchaeota archaeon]
MSAETHYHEVALLNPEGKERLYQEAVEEIKNHLGEMEKGIIVPRMATVVAVLMHKMPHYFWCGFYFS